MYRVSINKSTGKVIEMQSGGDEDEALRDSRLATLTTNALNAGYTADQIEAKWVTDAEYAALIAPTAEEVAAQMKQQAIDGIDAILDAQAQKLSFSTINTAAKWTLSKNPARKARADALVAWGDAVWDWAEAEWAKQEAGTPTYMDVETFLAAVPAFPGVTG
jgi:hypothetical protein